MPAGSSTSNPLLLRGLLKMDHNMAIAVFGFILLGERAAFPVRQLLDAALFIRNNLTLPFGTTGIGRFFFFLLFRFLLRRHHNGLDVFGREKGEKGIFFHWNHSRSSHSSHFEIGQSRLENGDLALALRRSEHFEGEAKGLKGVLNHNGVRHVIYHGGRIGKSNFITRAFAASTAVAFRRVAAMDIYNSVQA